MLAALPRSQSSIMMRLFAFRSRQGIWISCSRSDAHKGHTHTTVTFPGILVDTGSMFVLACFGHFADGKIRRLGGKSSLSICSLLDYWPL